VYQEEMAIKPKGYVPDDHFIPNRKTTNASSSLLSCQKDECSLFDPGARLAAGCQTECRTGSIEYVSD
jgi:hypothetical protein